MMMTLSCEQLAERMAIINELTATLASATDIDQILDRTLTQVMDFLQVEAAEVFLTQEETRVLKRVMHRGVMLDRFWNRSQFSAGEGMVGRTALEGVSQSAALPQEAPRELDLEVVENGFREILCVPLTSRRGTVGVLCLALKSGQELNAQEHQFIQAICAWVGTVLENVRLGLQQRRLAVLEERERIGMDLHDGIIQSIYGVGLSLKNAELLISEDPDQSRARIQQSILDLDRTIRDIRTYILDLRPRQLQNETLLQGVQRVIQEFRVNTLVPIDLQAPPDGLDDLPAPQAVALFHICQEALANIAKHARARRVNVTLWNTGSRTLLEVSDDGRGFEQERSKRSFGHGLSNMQTRARNVGGDVEVTSEKGFGTTILAWVPSQNE